MNSPTPPEAAAPPPNAGTAPAAIPVLGRQAKWLVGLILVCAVAALFWPRGDGTFKEPGGFLLDAEGKAITLGPRLAQVSLVHFWATWCPPCIEEIPALQRLSQDFAGHPEFGIVMVAVDDSTTKVSSFLGAGADMVLYDPNWDVAHRYGTDKLPETYLVVGGQVVEKFVGQTDWGDAELRRKLQSYLGSAADGAAGTAPGS